MFPFSLIVNSMNNKVSPIIIYMTILKNRSHRYSKIYRFGTAQSNVKCWVLNDFGVPKAELTLGALGSKF